MSAKEAEAPGHEPVRTKDRFIVFGAPYIGDDEVAEVVSTLRSGWLGTGPKVARFEEEFKRYKAAEHATALSSCTAALHLSLIASGIGHGHEVITTPMTFAATVNAIIHTGATPVLADIDPLTMNIDPIEIERRITQRTKAILIVHFAGRPCDMDQIVRIADRYGLVLIEDSAHAIEAEYKGKGTGRFGRFGCFSFYVTKNLTTAEGGMVIAKDDEDISRIKMLGLHGLTKDAWKRFGADGYKHYFVQEAGFKYNMTDVQAALGLHQLRRIEENWKKRAHIWGLYNEAFKGLPLVPPAVPEENTRHGLHLYTMLVDEKDLSISRDSFLEKMTEQGIGVGVHYLSIPEHPYYRGRFGWRPEEWPNAMRIGRSTASIPLSVGLTDEDVSDVVSAVKKVVTGRKAVNAPRNKARPNGLGISPRARDVVSNMVLITGPARSGTTILGNLIQSAREVEYAFEPAAMFTLFPLINELAEKHWRILFETLCYEDLLNGLVSGRGINLNKNDDSCIFNAKPEGLVHERLSTSLTKERMESLVMGAVFGAKMPDITGCLPRFKDYYPSARVVAMARRANECINSVIRKKWFEDISEYSPALFWPYHIYKGCKLPHWADPEDWDFWLGASSMERAAYHYIRTMEPLSAIKGLILVNYHRLLSEPEDTIKWLFEGLCITATEKTAELVLSVSDSGADRADMVGMLPAWMRERILKIEERYF
ncbi:MAG: DegT/DnrJ/EryC1/StrS family aminotransferase [Deltaproteobacteria bacterium]|nr:DegT/DnrJ/EryC1/StrS family aminotransferase [Deltaproteobacteria bacterium]